MNNYVAFTPKIPGTRGKRARYVVPADAIPRGRDESGRVHTVTTITGTVLRYRIVACNLSGCFCDAELIGRPLAGRPINPGAGRYMEVSSNDRD